MEYEIVTLPEKIVAGLSARTNNTSPEMGSVISGLWERFYQEGVYPSIPGKVNNKALGIYTDYAGDEKADYTVLVGCEVTAEPQNKSYSLCRIPAGRYAKFIVRGDVVKAVSNAWLEIWRMGLPRRFQCDFEEYQDGCMEDAEVHIYVGLAECAGTVPESRCGILCSTCPYREQMGCAGCVHIEKPFWGESCPVKACCEEKQHTHCGQCAAFPCGLLHEMSYDEKQGDNGKRIEQCRCWKR